MLCPAHWDMVPLTAQAKVIETWRISRKRRTTQEAREARMAWRWWARASIWFVLVQIWSTVFTLPELPTGEPSAHRLDIDCKCPMCTQARQVAQLALYNQRYRSRELPQVSHAPAR